ncbi:MAG: YiiX/YebB-like N1pC/P60 family cysteine hydrolase [Burkholderiales bacterium]
MFAFNFMFSAIGKALARYLSETNPRYRPLATSDPEQLRAALRPGDVLLVEGNTRLSTAIKYLTQSTWSHAALYVGEIAGVAEEGQEPRVLIEADIVNGVWAVPLSAYSGMHTRICRPAGLSTPEVQRVVNYAVASLGKKYDLKNVFDLARYLLPTPPVPTRWRRKLLYFGSGEPTKAICSTLIAQAFQSIHYPILPHRRMRPAPTDDCNDCVQETFSMRHYSLFTPRDFDVSPYFQLVKPRLAAGFDYRAMHWTDDIETLDATRVGIPTDARAGQD